VDVGDFLDQDNGLALEKWHRPSLSRRETLVHGGVASVTVDVAPAYRAAQTS